MDCTRPLVALDCCGLVARAPPLSGALVVGLRFLVTHGTLGPIASSAQLFGLGGTGQLPGNLSASMDRLVSHRNASVPTASLAGCAHRMDGPRLATQPSIHRLHDGVFSAYTVSVSIDDSDC